MSKKEKAYLSGSVTLKGTFSQLRDPVDKSKVRSRGPGQIGQSKPSVTVRLGRIGVTELGKRMALAVRVLETGKGPAKGEDANLDKLKEVREELKEVKKELNLEKRLLVEAQAEILKGLGKEVPDEIPTPDPAPETKDSEEVKSEVEGPSSSLEEKLKDAASKGSADQIDPEEENPEVPDGDGDPC